MKRLDRYWDMLNNLVPLLGGDFKSDLDIDIFEDENGVVWGWELRSKKRVIFPDRDFAQLTKELFMLDKVSGYLINRRHSYHFQPSALNPSRYSFRIDKDAKELHANPDPYFWEGKNATLKRHLYPPDLKLDITNFSFLYFLYTTVLYRQGRKYPLLQDTDDDYNAVIEKTRKQVQA